MKTRVYLSDGEPCEVTRLGIFDLDGVGPDLPGPFRYTYELSNGQLVESPYDISARSTAPRHPGIPEDQIVKHTPEWWQLLEFETYQAALAYEVNIRLPATIQYIQEVSAYIVHHALSALDVRRIQTEEDYDLVYQYALVPQVTKELLAQVFKDHFGAKFDDKEIFEALERLRRDDDEGGKYDVFRLWEHEAMAKFSYRTEEEWADLPLIERVRKVASIGLPKLMESLESDRAMKEARKKNM